jgi:hypothetical protein
MSSACYSLRLGDFTCLSSKNISVNFEEKGETVGRSIRPFLFSFIPLSGAPRIEEAMNYALKGKDGDALIDIQIKYSITYIPFIYAQDMYEVKAEVIKTKKTPTQKTTNKPLRFYPSP